MGGATVSVSDSEGAGIGDFVTDANGMALIGDEEPLPFGSYTAVASKKGFVSSSFAIEHDGVADHVWAVLTPKLSCEPEQANASLTNMGFESGFEGWTLGYQTEGIEVSGADEFTSPWEGQAMARVGSSQASSGPAQPRGPNLLCQDFVATQDSESFAFNIFTYDYTGFDEFRFDVAVVAQDGEVLASYSQGAWGQGTSLKTSGWRGASIDTSGHIGETLRLVISSGGTQDSLYAFWAYLDSAQTVPTPVTQETAATTTSGSVTTDPVTGQVSVSMPFSQPSDLTLVVGASCPEPAEGAAPAPTVTILYNGASFPAAETPEGSGKYSATIPAGSMGSGGVLSSEVSCPGATTVVATLGSITLYDPSGIVSDAETGEPVVGADVYLHKVPGWSPWSDPGVEQPDGTCETNETKDAGAPWSQPAPTELGQLVNAASPEISPNVNPFVTNNVGYYGWDVAEGCWYVTVEAPGYIPLTSPVVGVPSEVTDLDLQLTPAPTEEPTDGPTDGPTDEPTEQPATQPTPAAGESVIWGLVGKGDSDYLLGDALVQAFPAGGGDEPIASSLTYGGYGYKNGVFALYVPAGDYVITVTPPEGAARKGAELGPVSVAADEALQLDKIGLPLVKGIRITALAMASNFHDFGGVESASVQLTTPDGQVLSRLTGSTGRVFFGDLPGAGKYHLTMTKTGREPVSAVLKYKGNRLKKTYFMRPAPVPEAGESVIWGVVTKAGSRRLVADATVQAISVDGDGSPEASALTYEGYLYKNGVFALYVPAGTYHVVATPPDGLARGSVERGPVTVEPDEALSLGAMKLPMLPGLVVRVRDSHTGKPIADADVQLTAEEAEVPGQLSDSNGKAFFTDLPSKVKYLVSATKTGYESGERKVGYKGGRSQVTFYLDRTPVPNAGEGVIWGVVRKAGSRNGFVADALVRAVPVGETAAAATSLTYGGYGYRNGVFALYVPPGDYHVTVTPPEGVDRQGVDLGVVSVGADQAAFEGVVKLPYLPGVVVRVSGSQGHLSGATVRLTGPEGFDEVIVTEGDGKASFADLPAPGTYQVTISKIGYLPITETIEFDGQRVKLVRTLAPDFNCTPQAVNPSLTNMGFEQELDGWTMGHQTEGIVVSGTDEFTSPWEGQKMARIGSSQPSSSQNQPPGTNILCQDFTATKDVESFAFNIFTYDYTGFDEFFFDVTVLGEGGEILASYQQGAWGQGTALKTSGWRGASIDTSQHIGEDLRLVLRAGGTSDSLYAFWAYVDSAQTAPTPVNLDTTATSTSGSVTTDPVTGQVLVSMPFSQPSDLTLSVKASCPEPDEGAAPTPTVTILYDGTSYPTTETSAGSGTFTATIPADSIGSGGVLSSEVSCPGATTLVTTLGTITLYDPSGIVSDAVTGQPIVGAEVSLYKVQGWTPWSDPTIQQPADTCVTNETKAPGAPWSQQAPTQLGQLVNAASPEISPHVNPFVTNNVGYYGWDVAEGCWYVVVEAQGYTTLTSPVVGVPSEVTDLDLALTPVTTPGGGGGGGGGNPTPTPTITNTAKPAITGDAVVGGSLAASQGTWDTGGLTFAYQWLRDGEAIDGATAAGYDPVLADLGKVVSVKVTATKSGSTPGTATSDPVTVEKGAAPQSSAAPEITGTPELGETLTVSDGEWDLEDLTFGYQWLRDGEAIEGATEATYVVTEDDLGTELAAEVTATKEGHEDGSATSEAVTVPDEPEVVEPVESVTKARLLGKKVKQGNRGQVKVRVLTEAEEAPAGTVTVTAGKKSVEVELTEADNGTLKIRLPKLKPGKHEVSVEYSGDDATLASSDDAGTLEVIKKSKGKKNKKNKGKDQGERTGGGRPLPALL
ncbi:carboxypeptidase regulatory-like domain-containing protein [Nocardioides sp. REDSEA-S30_B4]|uniref:carboxypeptidase regulatory-like domain-containing protein n=1 Tax=Nocardioides sp. REDSEA-S30_B4 TaxID=1811552 RepID=UPI0025E52172|nr:carboxypeptidase regulatory-like domain-containing protein [Nocardioides sp. REDSEA-S30_B4]